MNGAGAAGPCICRYELFTPTALAGAHNVAALTFKGGVSLLLVASATEKQWDAAETQLRTVIESFRIGLDGAMSAA